MAAKKLMNVHETLEYLENLGISSDDALSDDEDFISRGKLPHGDEGSEDENELLPNNLNRSQLLSGATVDLSTSSGNTSLGAGDEEEIAGPSVDLP